VSSSNLATIHGDSPAGNAKFAQHRDEASSSPGSTFEFDFDALESAEFSGQQKLALKGVESICDERLYNQCGFVSEYSLPSGEVINIRELPLADGVHASTGCQLWPASMALGHFLLSEPSLIAGKSLIELGAGCGFAGIVAARYASQCIITDADQETVENLRYNLLTNRKLWLEGCSEGSSPEVLAETLLWEDVVKNGWPPARRADVVIGSDIIYGNWGALVTKVVQNIMVPSGTVIMISATDRGGLTEFKACMEGAGFNVDLSDYFFDGKRFLLYKCGPRSLTKKT
jgi:predicted nicotinamide N-methyase